MSGFAVHVINNTAMSQAEYQHFKSHEPSPSPDAIIRRGEVPFLSRDGEEKKAPIRGLTYSNNNKAIL